MRKGKPSLKDLFNKSIKNIQETSKTVRDEIKKGYQATANKMQDIGQQASSSSRQAVDTAKEGMSTFGENMAEKTQPMRDNMKTVATKGGRRIQLHGDDIAKIGAGVIAGMSGLAIFQALQPEEKAEGRLLISNYQEVLEDEEITLELEDWRAFVANISAELETQLRFQVGYSPRFRNNLYELLVEAERHKLVEEDDLTKLHQFRYIRNGLLHNADYQEFDEDAVVWTADYVQNF